MMEYLKSIARSRCENFGIGQDGNTQSFDVVYLQTMKCGDAA